MGPRNIGSNTPCTGTLLLDLRLVPKFEDRFHIIRAFFIFGIAKTLWESNATLAPFHFLHTLYLNFSVDSLGLKLCSRPIRLFNFGVSLVLDSSVLSVGLLHLENLHPSARNLGPYLQTQDWTQLKEWSLSQTASVSLSTNWSRFGGKVMPQ